jgi:hypothetical protein
MTTRWDGFPLPKQLTLEAYVKERLGGHHNKFRNHMMHKNHCLRPVRCCKDNLKLSAGHGN